MASAPRIDDSADAASGGDGPGYIIHDPEYVPLDSGRLTHLANNPNRGDVVAVARSYAVFGQLKPIVVRRTGDGEGEILAGNTSYEAVRLLRAHAEAMAANPTGPARDHAVLDAREELGEAAANRIAADVDEHGDGVWSAVLVNWTGMAEDEGRAFALADNRTARLGQDDPRALLAMIEQVQAAEAGLLGPAGFDDADIKDLAREVRDLDRLLPPVPADDAPDGGDGPVREGSTGSLARPSLTPAERLDAYEASSIRSVVLPMSRSLYEWVTSHLAAIRRDLEVETNVEAIVHLIEERVGGTAPRDAEVVQAASAVNEDDDT